MAFTPTLSKFGVPLIPGTSGIGILQPKLKYRFRVTMQGFAGAGPSLILTRQVKTCTRPSVDFSETRIDSYNNVMWIPQKPLWSPIDLVVLDDVASGVSSLIQYQLQRQHNFFDQTSALAGANFKFLTTIETLDGGDDLTLETWTLEGCYLKNVTTEGFDFASSDPVTISMNIRFDNATGSTTPIDSSEGIMAG